MEDVGENNVKSFLPYYCGKRVFVTGHTGFKGSWLCRILLDAGAEVIGYALEPPTEPNLYELAGLKGEIHSIIGDIRDLPRLQAAFQQTRPEIVFHLAAQPIVRQGYRDPVGTYSTNVMGTVHVLECVRQSDSVQSVINVTTDKVYHNQEWVWGYRETERLDGFDPYSNSKSCSELVTSSYIRSFFAAEHLPVSTMRAGNVIGGGDFAEDRIVPDCIRGALAGEQIIVRNPNSVRPYQHVLEPLMAYLLVAERQTQDYRLAGSYNVGPDECDCVTTGALVDLFCDAWGEGVTWACSHDSNGSHEANFLRLDCSKIKSMFGWHSRWHVDTAIQRTVEWVKLWQTGNDIVSVMERDIREYSDFNI